ncbi:uncharacterized protein LOC122534977 isoform X1 [Frieseomelitta varia]|uniref:uncharacterized protein LOC122534977 isoform X1 n=1 Tax=Frieseomelitta varia TaxID=561572 RepID=UPI001CB6A39A|nr:uncharacterized protein LOC122534977 isoform X1 [Frieseomelitta varia]
MDKLRLSRNCFIQRISDSRCTLDKSNRVRSLKREASWKGDRFSITVGRDTSIIPTSSPVVAADRLVRGRLRTIQRRKQEEVRDGLNNDSVGTWWDGVCQSTVRHLASALYL